MVEWLLAVILVSLLYLAWGVVVVASIYACTLMASRFPLVGKGSAVAGARRLRHVVVKRLG